MHLLGSERPQRPLAVAFLPSAVQEAGPESPPSPSEAREQALQGLRPQGSGPSRGPGGLDGLKPAVEGRPSPSAAPSLCLALRGSLRGAPGHTVYSLPPLGKHRQWVQPPHPSWPPTQAPRAPAGRGAATPTAGEKVEVGA